MVMDSAALVELARTFHQHGTDLEKVRERDFVPLRWHHKTAFTCRVQVSVSKSEAMSLGRREQSQWLFCRHYYYSRQII